MITESAQGTIDAVSVPQSGSVHALTAGVTTRPGDPPVKTAPPRSRAPSGDRPDALTIYLREIGQLPLLTRAQEVELAVRVAQGDREAQCRMVNANLRLVVKIAHDYASYGLPLLDLISEGNIGLMKAVERFNPARGAKLSTYAALWIKQSIRRALSNQSKTIRLPVHVGDNVGKISRLSLKFSEAAGRDPTDEELAQQLNLTAAKVAHLRAVSRRPASLDAALGGDEGNSDGRRLGDLIADRDASDPFDSLREKDLHAEVREHLRHLEDREASIITMRFGLDGQPPQTLEKVSRGYQVTRERIRQIQDMALAKLRRMMEHELRGPVPIASVGRAYAPGAARS